ncbi:MAG: DUF2922 domain-containing protein [Defluviitaleaceae bacterium]|nr:DUF2922 domain-containing protein [Defluviitaleaceae bacterium]MCL2240335.1 DUF2922 domain-containing protein [Defluviitaleaceae bacterium]
MTYYTLAFNTHNGGRRQFRIKNVTTGLTPEAITAAVDKLIAHNIMHPERGALERLNRMDATTTSVTRIK